MKTAVLGGTFDPPHSGHIAMAQAAIHQLELDEVLLLPAHRNPMKSGRVTASGPDRLAMLTLAIEDQQKLAVCDVELTRGGPSYMVESLMELQMVRQSEYWLLMGADSLATFPKWKQPERILRMCRLAAVQRGVHAPEEMAAWLPEEFRASLDIIDMKAVDISSSDIRERLAKRQPVSTWVNAKVLRYIEEHRLYRS